MDPMLRRVDGRRWLWRDVLANASLVSVIVGLVVFAGYTLLWNRWIRSYYYPTGDNFSILVNSLPTFHPDVGGWFTRGFQQYFHVYPDLSRNATNFIRPGVNATFFLEWFFFGLHWERYLLTTYAVIATIAGLVYYTATQMLSVSRRLALLASFAAGFAPSVDTNALWDPTFAFDLLAGVLVLAGILALLNNRLWLAWVLLGFAAFTKETALFAPAMAALVLFLRKDTGVRRRVARSAIFLLPLVAWGALRWLDFHGDKGFYVLMQDAPRHGALHEAVVRLIPGALSWPIATTVYRNETLPLLRFIMMAGTTLSIVFWLGLAAVVGLKYRKGTLQTIAWLRTLAASGPRAAPVVITLFCIGSLAMPMLLNIPRRFGGVFFPLFALCMAMAAQYASLRLVRLAAVVLTLCVGVAGALLLSTDLRYLHSQQVHSWRISRAYIAALHESTEPLLFSVDDTSGVWSSDLYVQRFAGYRGRLIRVNDLSWNATCPPPPDFRSSGGGWRNDCDVHRHSPLWKSPLRDFIPAAGSQKACLCSELARGPDNVRLRFD